MLQHLCKDLFYCSLTAFPRPEDSTGLYSSVKPCFQQFPTHNSSTEPSCQSFPWMAAIPPPLALLFAHQLCPSR